MSSPIVAKTDPLTGRCHCGAVSWTYAADPKSATACNCTICRKSGVLWIYEAEGDVVSVAGNTAVYVRQDHGNLEFHHCQTCGNSVMWRLAVPDADGITAAAVNLRLTNTVDRVMDLPIRHFDGLVTFKATADDGKTVRDLWF